MKVEFINPFVTATINVVSTTLGCELTRGNLRTRDQSQPEHDVSALLHVSGAARGTLLLGLSREVALAVAEKVLRRKQIEINADVLSSADRLMRQIAVEAMSRLSDLKIAVGSPSVICGHNHVIECPENTRPLCVPFECEWGSMTLEAGLVECAVLAGV